MYIQDSLVVILVSTGSLMYKLSTVHHVESSFDLFWDWLILSLSDMAWWGQPGFSSCGFLTYSGPAWLIYFVVEKDSKRRSRSHEVSQVLGSELAHWYFHYVVFAKANHKANLESRNGQILSSFSKWQQNHIGVIN